MRAAIIGGKGQLGPIWSDLLANDGYDVRVYDPPGWDVRDPNDVQLMADAMEWKCNLLVYNAAVDNPPGSKVEDDERIMQVNLIGAANTMRAFAPMLRENRPSNIVLIGSMLGFIAPDPRNYCEGWDKPWAYGASKAGLWQLCRHFAVRWAKVGIVVNMLALSGVDTPKLPADFKEKYIEKIPIGRMLKPDDFSREFLTVCKATVPYDFPLFVGGGWTLW